MNEENQVYFIDSDELPPQVLERKHRLEQDPSFRTDHMQYLPGMEVIDSDIKDLVLSQMKDYDCMQYTARDVQRALSHDSCSIEDFKALLSPAAAPFLEQMARKAELLTKNHFGNTVYIFTPIYIANYCQNYCIYCGFNCYNKIRRKKLDYEQIEHEMQVIAQTGMEEVLLLTGESRKYSDVHYIGEAVKIARRYFRNIGIEIYPVNVEEYRYLHECGVDYVTVFQETYDTDKYEALHLLGHKRVWPYRFDAQERALRGGMRGVAFSALLGLADFRRDALATALHAFYMNRRYPHAEISLSCPRLRPIVNNERINPRDVGERELCQVLCAYRIFLPFAGITVSSRESAAFRNGITKICATKVSAGVSTGIGDHEEKYEKNGESGDGSGKLGENSVSGDGAGKLGENSVSGNGAGKLGENSVSGDGAGKLGENSESDDGAGKLVENSGIQKRKKLSGQGTGEKPGPAAEGESDAGDEQFEINDGRSFAQMYADLENGGLQPVLNDYIYV